MPSESTPNSEEREAIADILMSDALRMTPFSGRDYALAEADAVLAAGYRRQEGEAEYEWRRVMRDGRPKLEATFDHMPLLDEGWAAERREVGEWVPVTGPESSIRGGGES